MTTLRKTRTPLSMLACAAMVAGGLAAPPDAQADVVTATVLGGAALLSTLLHSSQPVAPVPVAYPQPMAVMAPVQTIPVYQPVPYPVPYPVPVPVVQPVSYQVTTRVIQPVSYQVTTQVAQPMVAACAPMAVACYPR